ncbi:hypothetical protein A3K63_01035 [Candidatus Micrarchaeota archaeon RBG_16_49_10]|nr:MAG: hypothetical protein A3K63_01035 [Candidatus Micrarchaeota archaeon RBG_16_49_10]
MVENKEMEAKEDDKEDLNLPFPSAPIVRLMKENMDDHKLIRKQVKQEMNLWLAKLCINVSKKMNESPYPTIDLPLFRQAIAQYEDVEELKKEKERIIVSLQKVKMDCDSLIRDLERKFE